MQKNSKHQISVDSYRQTIGGAPDLSRQYLRGCHPDQGAVPDVEHEDINLASGAGACVGGDCDQKFGGDYQCDYHGDYHGSDCDQKLSDNYHGRNDWEETQTITTTGPETFL